MSGELPFPTFRRQANSKAPPASGRGAMFEKAAFGADSSPDVVFRLPSRHVLHGRCWRRRPRPMFRGVLIGVTFYDVAAPDPGVETVAIATFEGTEIALQRGPD